MFPKVLKIFADIHKVGIGHVMRKLNGITINGEYLGNSVVINGMFRAICTISPVIMRDFVQIINKIDRLDEAVKINNFNCGFDSIDIEFKNSNAKGIASLYFKLRNGEPELTDCRLIIDDKEYSTLSETIIVPELVSPDNKIIEPSEEDIARRQRLSELKAKKLEQIRQERNGKLNNEKASKVRQPNNSSDIKGRVGNNTLRQNNNTSPMSKREELLERKKQIMEARAQKAEKSIVNSATNPATGDSISSDNAANPSAEKLGTPENLPAKKDSLSESSALGRNNKLPDEANTLNNTTDSYNKQNQTADENNTYNTTDNTDTFGEGNDKNYNEGGFSSKFGNLEDIDIENLSDEELAELEAELEMAEMDSNSDYSDDYNYNDNDNDSDNYNSDRNYGYDMNFAQSLSQGLVEGLTQGLSQGLAQGLAMGLSQGLGSSNSWGGGNAGSQNFDNGGFRDNFDSGVRENFNGGFGDNFDGGFGSSSQGFGSTGGSGFSDESNYGGVQNFNAQPQQIIPDYNRIDTMNADASMAARDDYSYDENSDLDGLSDLYSDFYAENQIADSEGETKENAQNQNAEKSGPNTSEVDALRAELEALRAEAEVKKDLMSLDEFLEKQRELADAKEKKRRQKLKIVGSKERVNASALEGGVFVAGTKVYKWGDTRVLND